MDAGAEHSIAKVPLEYEFGTWGNGFCKGFQMEALKHSIHRKIWDPF